MAGPDVIDTTADPGLLVVCARRPRRHPRLVQGELAAGEDGRARPARLRPGAEQRLVQRRAGATRGIHAEPWDKFVSVATGRVFGAWVDLREGAGVRHDVHRRDRTRTTAVFVPRGVGNAFQTLEDATAYTYLVNDHWRPAAKDPTPSSTSPTRPLAIAWPIPLDAGRALRRRTSATRGSTDVVPMPPQTDADPRRAAASSAGRCRRASRTRPRSTADELDLGRPGRGRRVRLGAVRRGAQRRRLHRRRRRRDRRRPARRLGGQRQRASARWSPRPREHRFTLVHFSSDYVFDGTAESHARGRAALPAGRLRPDQGRRRRRWSPPRPRHYVAAHLLGDRRRQQLRPHHAALADRGVSPGGGRRPGRPAHLHRRARPGDPAPARHRARRTAPTTSPTAARR